MSRPEPPSIESRTSIENDSTPSTDDRKPELYNQELLSWCEQILLFTERAQKAGHITEQGRYRINESMLQESFIRGRLSEDAFAENAIRSQLGPISTSVVVAVAGERSSLVQTRDIIGSSVVTGDHNIVTTTMRQVAPAPADQVDVRAELAALQQLLAQLKNVPDRGRLGRAMQDAVEEVAKPEPDKAEVGNALERVTRCAKAASDFTENAEKIVPRLVALGSWLGPAGRALLNSLGVAI